MDATIEPPPHGLYIEARGRILSSDDYETWIEPFQRIIMFERDAWYLCSSYPLQLKRSPDDVVIVDAWRMPKAIAW